MPGTWIEPPQPGLLWTPGYWAFVDGVYAFHRGYWGEHVGFYGGVDYGFGYGGVGFEGGRWDNGRFFYNRSVTNIGRVNITNVYEQPVTVRETNRASFNGGPNGVDVKPTAAELEAAKEKHVAPTHDQLDNARVAGRNESAFVSANKGKPASPRRRSLASSRAPRSSPPRPPAARCSRAGARPATPGTERFDDAGADQDAARDEARRAHPRGDENKPENKLEPLKTSRRRARPPRPSDEAQTGQHAKPPKTVANGGFDKPEPTKPTPEMKIERPKPEPTKAEPQIKLEPMKPEPPAPREPRKLEPTGANPPKAGPQGSPRAASPSAPAAAPANRPARGKSRRNRKTRPPAASSFSAKRRGARSRA